MIVRVAPRAIVRLPGRTIGGACDWDPTGLCDAVSGRVRRAPGAHAAEAMMHERIATMGGLGACAACDAAPGASGLGAIWDPFVKFAESLWELASDLAKSLGLDKLTRPMGKFVEDVWNGPLRDFARTGVGKVVLRAMALSFSAAAAADQIRGGAQVLTAAGPAGANVAALMSSAAPTFAAIAQQLAYAGPGLARGESLIDAYTHEMVWQATVLLEYISKDAFAGLQGDISRWLREMRGKVDAGTVSQPSTWFAAADPDQLAIDFGFSRVDAALQSYAVLTGSAEAMQGWIDYIHAPDYDPETGTRATSRLSPGYAERAERAAMEAAVADAIAFSAPFRGAPVDVRKVRGDVMAPLLARQAEAIRPLAEKVAASSQPAPARRHTRTSDAALAGLVLAAAAAYALWYRSQKARRA